VLNKTDSENYVLSDDSLEWEYPGPPTVYDLFRDNFLMRLLRLSFHFFLIRNLIKHFDSLCVKHADFVLNNSPCIITPNHSSHLDAPVLFTALPLRYINRTCVPAAKDYFFKNPFISLLAQFVANVIPVDRSGIESRGILICFSQLKKGKNILIFPEGTRSRDGKVGEFKIGAIVLSKRARYPIIPASIRGTLESLPKGKHWPRRSQITISFGEPVCYWDTSFNKLTYEQMARDLEKKVITLI
jgi:1-acyl-sn-glycerol-3-phosphate acyltransferase